MISFNNKLILEPYTGGKGVKAEVKSGFASVKRSQLVGLKVLVSARIFQGNNEIQIVKGSTVFITEEYLTIHQNYHSPMENVAVGVPFVVGEFSHVVMVKE